MNVKPWHVLLILLIAIPFIGGTYTVIHENLTRGSTDLYPTWMGAKLFWEEGISPYDDEVGERSQQAIYDRPAQQGDDQFLYVYPFYGIFYLGPLALTTFKISAAVYMEGLLLGLLLSLILSLHVMKWLPPPLVLAILILWTMIGYFSARGMFLGQPALLAYAARMIALWGLYKQREGLSGAALAISTIKPQTGVLIVPLLLIWAWRTRRYRLLTGFGMVFGGLMLASFIAQPSWFGDWLGQIERYEGYTETLPTAYHVTHAIDAIPDRIKNAAQVALSLGLLFLVGQFWKDRLMQADGDNFLWGYALTMTVTLLIVPRVATTYYVEVYLVLYVTAFIMTQQRQTLWFLLFSLAGLIGYWLLHVVSVQTLPEAKQAGGEAAIVYVVFPVIILFLLLYYRAKWQRFSLTKDHIIS